MPGAAACGSAACPPALALCCHLCSSFHPCKLCLEINKSWAPGCCTAVTPAEPLPASLIPPGCLCWVRGSKCGRKGVSPEQRRCPRFAPRTPITWCRWDGCPPHVERSCPGWASWARTAGPRSPLSPRGSGAASIPAPRRWQPHGTSSITGSPSHRAAHESCCSSAHAAVPTSLFANSEAESHRLGSSTVGPGEAGGPSKPPQHFGVSAQSQSQHRRGLTR